MTLYQDPKMPGRLRPSLVADLLGQPAWDQHHQLENQATIVLAWMIDRSPPIGSRLLDLWLDDVDLAEGAVIGARSQIEFPSKLRPDISIEVSDRAIQLLIEAKVGAQFAEHTGVVQDDSYRVEWAGMGEGEAEVQAVGTLTRDALGLPDEVDVRSLRARDVTWRELRMTLEELVENGSLEAPIADVVGSFCEAIDLHIDVVSVDEGALPEFHARAGPVVEAVAARLGESLGTAPSIAHGAHYAGAKLSYQALDGQPVVLRVVAGVPGGSMTPIGSEPTLLVGVGRDHHILLKGEDRARALNAGLELLKTPQFTFTGIRVPFERAEQEPQTIPSRVLSALTTATMLPPGRDPERSKLVGEALGYEHKGHINLPPGWRPTPAVNQTTSCRTRVSPQRLLDGRGGVPPLMSGLARVERLDQRGKSEYQGCIHQRASPGRRPVARRAGRVDTAGAEERMVLDSGWLIPGARRQHVSSGRRRHHGWPVAWGQTPARPS